MGIVALRDRALFSYLLTTGARVSEALQAHRDDFTAPIVRLKGGRMHTLRPSDIAIEYVREYLAVRVDDNPWCWVTHKTNAPLTRLRPPGVWEVWQKLAPKVGVEPWTTHQLRHTCVTEMLENGISILVAAKHVGHKGTGSMHIYGQVRERQKREAVEVMDGLLEKRRPYLLPKIARHERY